MSGNRADGGLVAGVDVGAFVAIDFHGDEELVDDRGDFGILVTLAVDDVAPVAPHRADIEQHRLALGARLVEGFFAPFVPVDGLVRGGAQIRAGGVFQAICSGLSHRASS